MKKFFTCSLAVALGFSISAEELKVLTLGLGIPGQDEPQLIGLGISPDGHYVCGSIEYGEGVFVMDLENDQCAFDVISDSELRKVSDTGLAIGFAEGETASTNIGITYSWNGEMELLDTPEPAYKYVLGEAITSDGCVKVGSLVGSAFVTYGAYSVDGGEWKMLPMPPAEQLGNSYEGSSAKGISGDGRYIIGHAGNFGPIILWTRNDAGEYEADPLFARYCAFDECEADEKPLAGLSPQAISPNGKYVLCTALRYDFDEDGYEYVHRFPAVYDTEAESIKLYDEPQEIDLYGLGLMGSAIADDGTFVGIVGRIAMYECTGSFVMKPGDTQARLLKDVYPAYEELFSFPDEIGYSIATGISADASKILGYSYYSDDFFDDVSPAYFVTYIIDTATGTSVDKVDADCVSGEIYSLDGVRLTEMKRGVNIVRSADGSVRKVFKK